MHLMLVRCAVCSSKYNRGGVKRDADKGQRIYQVLEIGQDGRRHLDCHVHYRHSFRC